MPPDTGERSPDGRDGMDWAAVEADYRAGELSIRQIAAARGCSDTAIRLRAKAEGWTRELRSPARAETAKCEVRSAKSTGNGPGWGGPARGAGSDAPAARQFTPETARAAAMIGPSAIRADLKAQMRAVLAAIATDADAPPQARVAAADKLLDRLEGKPVQPNINMAVDDVGKLTDGELAAELARLGGTQAEAVAGGAREGVSAQPPRVVN